MGMGSDGGFNGSHVMNSSMASVNDTPAMKQTFGVGH